MPSVLFGRGFYMKLSQAGLMDFKGFALGADINNSYNL